MEQIIVRRFQPADFSGVIVVEREQFSEHDPYTYMTLYEIAQALYLSAGFSDFEGVLLCVPMSGWVMWLGGFMGWNG